jgi:hypothetical protein
MTTENIAITLTRDEWTAILEALSDYDVSRLADWQLDEFESGADKEPLFERIESKIGNRI